MNRALTSMPNDNPFAPPRAGNNPAPTPAFDVSLNNVIDRIARSEPLIPVIGEPGTGKTVMLAEIERRLRTRVTVQRLQRGDLLGAATDLPNVLLVDEGDRADPEAIDKLFAGGWRGTLVLACARDCVARLPAGRRSRPERLRLLRPGEARALARARLARAGMSGLVAPKALDELAKASKGNLRALVQIGGTAVFFARDEGSDVVHAEHVRAAVEIRRPLEARSPGTERPRRGRPWPITPRVRAAVRGHRAEALAGTGAVFAFVLLMLGGVGTPVRQARTTSGPAQANASTSRPQVLARAITQAEPVVPRETSVSGIADGPPALAGGSATHATVDPRPTPDRSKTSEDLPAATAPQSAIVEPPSRPSAQSEATSPELAYANALPTPTRPSRLPRAQAAGDAPSIDLPPVLAINLPVAPPTIAPTRPSDADQPIENDNDVRKAEIKARDAMRAMRIARGG